jgi:signal transduction histidine kinase
MIGRDDVRRLCGSHWGRVAAVSLAAALVVTLIFAAQGSSSSVVVTLQHALIHSTVMATLAGWLLPRLFARTGGWPVMVRWTLVIAMLLGVAVAGTPVACGLIGLLAVKERSFSACVASDVWINVVLTLVLGIGVLLYEVQRTRLDTVTLELRTRELDHERIRKMALEARLASLESRLRPHFLFNTLNAISALIQEDPDRAERTVERLAALLRFSLDATGRGAVPLTDELRIVAHYLEIEKTRLGDRLSYALDVAPEVAACEVPPLAIQTLAENSIKHAIAPRPEGGRVRVSASTDGVHLVVSVWDDGPGFTPAAIRPGHGLENLQSRLAARFGCAARLTVGRDDGGTLVTVVLPRTVGEAPPAEFVDRLVTRSEPGRKDAR